ncbi:hypothetical protein R2Q93_03020 [Clostridium perfringens]|uniref:hypothetical protein n=1 Tax=Clostridium perfringens TaxID=1502 RepID=UPI001C8BA40A|nr:hypothetical protein [Clostridium perfringens]MBX9098733.1 hypothetical protein [Clostridium perfringens]MDV5114137.1 hypothetical protein [Clostridium perfringens]
MMNKDKKSVGRNRKYSEEQLREIIDKYIEAHPFILKLQFKKIAEYANEYLNLEHEVSYQDFRRNPIIKSEIEGFNNMNTQPKLKITKESELKIVRFNVENFVDKYFNNPEMQKVLLNKFNKKYEDAFAELSKKDKKEQEYKDKILELEKSIKELKDKNKKLSVENRNLNTLNAKYNKQLEFKLNIDLYEDLISRKIVSSIDSENIRILLGNAGLIKVEEMVGTEKLDTCFTEEIISDIEGNDKEVMDEQINMNGENVTSMMDFFNNRRSKTVTD